MKGKVDITQLKKQLPRGTGTRIAKDLGITPQAVSIALRGNNPLHPAIMRAIEIRDRHREELLSIDKSIKSV